MARLAVWLGRPWFRPALLAAVFVGGAVVRFVGVRWGLPTRLHPDEYVVVEGAIDMARRNSFEPGYFARPDHLEMQLSYLAYMAYGYLRHGVPPEVVYAADPVPFVLISRLITAALGSLAVVVAYLVGRRFSAWTGVVAAFVVAFYPQYVEHSHYATPDVPLALAVLCLVLACLHYLERPGWWPLLFACLAVAAATAIKYPGILGCLVIAATVLAAAWRDGRWVRIVWHGAAAVGAVLGMLFVISPVLFTNFGAVIRSLRTESRTGHLGADGLGWGGNMLFYAGDFARAGGAVVVALAVVGVVHLLVRRDLRVLPLFAGIVIWVLLSTTPLHWSRWGLPMYVTPLLLAAVGLPVVVQWAGSRERLVRGAVGGVAAIAGATLILASLAATASLSAVDTRVASMDVVADLGATRENTLFEGYTPLEPTNPNVVFGAFVEEAGRLAPVVTDGATRPRFLILSSSMGDRYEADPQYQEQQAFYRQVEEQLPLLASVEPVRSVRPSFFVVPTAIDAVRYLNDLASGGLSGPRIRVFAVPRPTR